MLDVKGIGTLPAAEASGTHVDSTIRSETFMLGTHVMADISSEKVTGLLGLADALRLEPLAQRN